MAYSVCHAPLKLCEISPQFEITRVDSVIYGVISHNLSGAWHTVCAMLRSNYVRCHLNSLLCQKIHKIYGRITGNQLPVPVPLFLREPVKYISRGRTVSHMVA